ncbi:hypothetical protein LJB90_03155 [Eubacteriales bacterium OttesenSCG-928-G02]|nr:hypothetical protein [Eubacteriales bacterium OttesenSCG-928-G02]
MKEKITLKSRLENFWYFYKWQTILLGIIIIGGIFALIQSLQNYPSDVSIMYIGEGYLTPAVKTDMYKKSKDYMIDYNNDGHYELTMIDINIDMSVYDLSKEKNAANWEANAQAVQRFHTETAAGEAMIYIVEKSFYDLLLGKNILCPLNLVLDNDLIPENTKDEYSIQISELQFFNQEAFSSIPKEYILCLRRSPDDDTIKYGRSIEYWKSNVHYFKEIFRYSTT